MLRLTPFDTRFADLDQWPADVDLISSALEAARPGEVGNRRSSRRRFMRVTAQLSLFVNAGGPPTRVFSRDCDERHFGFLTQQHIPLGYGGTLEFIAPDGRPIAAGCTVTRCRECVPGWYEGVLQFNRPQAIFE